MSATFAPAPWPAAVGGGLRMGQRASGPDGPGVQWVLRRNCSVTPRQLGGFYLSLCALSGLIAAGFAWHGAVVVVAFAGIELLAVGAALLVYARHARDGDTLVLSGQWLAVEQACGPRTALTRFRTPWVSVEPSAGEGSLVEIRGEGQRVCVGRFVRPEGRAALAREIRQALRDARPHAPDTPDSTS
ncbi:MAG: DUF2244 domain-containing protein [Rubrivivax sp.]